MTAVCEYCKKEITGDAIVINGSLHFCSKHCEKAYRDRQDRLMFNDILERCKNILNIDATRYLGKELMAVKTSFSSELILSYLDQNEMYLSGVIRDKNLPSLVAKVNYLMTILDNELDSWRLPSDRIEKYSNHQTEFQIEENFKPKDGMDDKIARFLAGKREKNE